MQLPKAPSRTVRSTVFPTEREVLLARLLLRICDQFDWQEPLDEWLYNQLKPTAEAVLRQDRVARATYDSHNEELTDGDETQAPF